MAWPWSRRNKQPPEQVEERSFSVGDPATAHMLGWGLPNLTGVPVTEWSVLGLPAVWRSVSLIAGSIASLPMRTIETRSDGTTVAAKSFLDTPGGPNGLTAYEWVETVMAHLLIHGNAFLLHLYGGAGQLIGLKPLHPQCVCVEIQSDGSKLFRVSLMDGKVLVLNESTLTHIPALSTDGFRGLSPIQVARNSFGTSLAAERSAARMFANGALMSGLVTPDEDLSEEDAKAIKDSLRRNVLGEANAGDVAVINRKLKFQQWSLSAEDAQWLQSRSFQIEDVSRWFGIPSHLLSQNEKQTSWGSGVSEQNRALARFVLQGWTSRVEQRLSRLLPPSRKVQFDYHQLLKPAPEAEVALLVQQVGGPILTVNEARAQRNLPPLAGGDVLLAADPKASETEAQNASKAEQEAEADAA